MIPWSKFLENVIDVHANAGYFFNKIAEMQIITVADNLDMSYDFYTKHNMHAVE